MSRMLKILALALLVPMTAPARVIDRVVAVVNDEVVTLSELEDLIAPILRQIETLDDPVLREQQRQKQLRAGLDDLIGQKLVGQEGVVRRISVQGDEVQAHLERVKASQGWDDEKLRIYLTSQGLNLAEFRKQVREQLLRQKVIRASIGGRIRVGEAELRDYYRSKLTQANADFEVEAAHIALPVPTKATPAEEAAIRQQANELLARAQGGEDFAGLARQYSQAPGAENGGSLGAFRRGVIDPAIEKVVFDLEAGQAGGPVRTGYGYHVVQCVAKRKLPPPPFEESKAALQNELTDKKLQEELGKWIEELKRKAFIEIRL
ncbi:MAG: peptidylprolyl isomerase [Myxococcales bacterium]|nr:peptidylprolyl isomerase [Myxococcales bacterium]MCB9522980.1 peptidylprolyl isomerase [Myxococcales bacterium]